MSKKTKSQYWEEKLVELYPEIEEVNCLYRNRQTRVYLTNGQFGVAKCGKGDKWNFEMGFYVAYAKALRNTIKKIKSNL